MLLLHRFRVRIRQRGSWVQAALFVLGRNSKIQLFALGNIAHELPPPHDLLSLVRRAQVVGDYRYQARHDCLDHVHGEYALANLAQRRAHRSVDLVDECRALADATVPALHKVAQYQANQHVQAVRHNERGGVYGLHHVLVALGERCHLARPPLRLDKCSMASSIVGFFV